MSRKNGASPDPAVIYFGLKLNKAVLQRDANTTLQLEITLAGTALWAFTVGIWIVCIVAGKLSPESSLGSFVNTADGLATVVIASFFFAAAVGAILEKLGYPIMRKRVQ